MAMHLTVTAYGVKREHTESGGPAYHFDAIVKN